MLESLDENGQLVFAVITVIFIFVMIDFLTEIRARIKDEPRIKDERNVKELIKQELEKYILFLYVIPEKRRLDFGSLGTTPPGPILGVGQIRGKRYSIHFQKTVTLYRERGVLVIMVPSLTLIALIVEYKKVLEKVGGLYTRASVFFQLWKGWHRSGLPFFQDDMTVPGIAPHGSR
ncbi:hypothetical protein J6590_087214 [Homalodisca vitripennis]|nr:hypothetical protein J6590_087214 [Homalodisca vitripennis]